MAASPTGILKAALAAWSTVSAMASATSSTLIGAARKTPILSSSGR